MEISTIIGLVLGMGMILGAYILEGGSIAALLQITAVMIVFGGTFGTAFTAFTMTDIKRTMSMTKCLFQATKSSELELVDQISELSDKARREGLLSLEQDAQKHPNALIRKGVSLIVDGIEPDTIRIILFKEAQLNENEYKQAAAVWDAMGGYAPTMGIVGTVLGLVSVLSNLSDPDSLGEKIALAFIATLFGVGSANLWFLPFGNKLKLKAKKEKQMSDLIIEGVLSIQAGENPRIIKEKLSYLTLQRLAGKKPDANADKDKE